jgi:dipeptidase D
MNAVAECSGDYPAWEYLANSPLRDTMVRVFRETSHREPALEVIHAGLECGILGAKIEGLDCVSIGPDMKDIHSPDEMLCLPSVNRVWQTLLDVLRTW